MRGNRTRRYFSKYIKGLPQLSEKEKAILISRVRGKTLETIGEKFSVTEARVRQIEKKALIKVKKKIYQQKLFTSKP